MAVDPAFAGAGVRDGMELWRIENKCPVKIPEVNGKFHTGDSYILLRSIQTQSAMTWNLHFWLGNETSQDEMGIAAYKTVELDEALGGGPVQYRECQGNESSLFMSYFKTTGVEYLEGGVESGFKHVDRDAYETRLLQLKGKRVVRASPVPVSNTSLNKGDVFLLDMGLKIFLWNGENSNRYEKAKGVEVAHKIRNEERGARAEIIIVNEDPSNAEFWGALGGQINVTNEGEDDAAAERNSAAAVVLYHVSDATGSLVSTPVERDNGRYTRAQLRTEDAFILDADSELFVWIGRGASAEEKKQGMILAQQYITSNNKPNSTRVSRVVEGGETPVFKSHFYQWEPPRSVDFNQRPAGSSSGVAAARQQEAIDMNRMTTRSVGSEAESMVATDGTVQIWRIENFERAAWPEDKTGEFYGGDSYVILYTYIKGGAEEYIIYFWQGRDSSQDEKGASALQAKNLDDELDDRPVQVRVVQGKEPAHFRAIFKGRMVVHSGGVASGFKNRNEGDSYDTDGVSLYHVKGTNEMNTAAVQVPEETRFLNSGDCFILLSPANMYVWQGQYSNEIERTTAHSIAARLKDMAGVTRTLVTVNEGEEDDAFWGFLGGRGEYPKDKALDEPSREPRLFQMSNATGVFDVEEIPNFAQDDLCDDDVMLLDCYSSVFCWVGSQANETEKRMAMETAQQYVTSCADGRDPDTSIIRVSPGNEPSMFTMHFLGWDPDAAKKNKFIDPYEARLAKMRAERGEEEKVEVNVAAPAPTGIVTASRGFDQSVAYEELKAGTVEGIDPANKHMYLSDAEFMTVFGVTKDAFNGLPKWKQTSQKKSKGLF